MRMYYQVDPEDADWDRAEVCALCGSDRDPVECVRAADDLPPEGIVVCSSCLDICTGGIIVSRAEWDRLTEGGYHG